MTKFEPEVAYRILKARQDRLYDQSTALFHERTELDLKGKLNYYGGLWRGWEVNSLEDEADQMWDVLDYLKARIEEEKHDTV